VLSLVCPERPLLGRAFGWPDEMTMMMAISSVIVARVGSMAMKMGRRVVLPLLVACQPAMRVRYGRHLAGEHAHDRK